MRFALKWHHDKRYDVSNHRRLDCSFNRLFRRRSRKISKLRVTGLCEGNSLVTGEFPAQRASNAENAFTLWRHHGHSRDLPVFSHLLHDIPHPLEGGFLHKLRQCLEQHIFSDATTRFLRGTFLSVVHWSTTKVFITVPGSFWVWGRPMREGVTWGPLCQK